MSLNLLLPEINYCELRFFWVVVSVGLPELMVSFSFSFSLLLSPYLRNNFSLAVNYR